LRGIGEIAVYERGEEDEGEEAEGPAVDEVCAEGAEVGASGGHECEELGVGCVEYGYCLRVLIAERWINNVLAMRARYMEVGV